VAAENHQRLSLAVDARNVPALKLYYRQGMTRVTSKLAFMRDLRKNFSATVDPRHAAQPARARGAKVLLLSCEKRHFWLEKACFNASMQALTGRDGEEIVPTVPITLCNTRG